MSRGMKPNAGLGSQTLAVGWVLVTRSIILAAALSSPVGGVGAKIGDRRDGDARSKGSGDFVPKSLSLRLRLVSSAGTPVMAVQSAKVRVTAIGSCGVQIVWVTAIGSCTVPLPVEISKGATEKRKTDRPVSICKLSLNIESPGVNGGPDIYPEQKYGLISNIARFGSV
jgi:hypothetical protein